MYWQSDTQGMFVPSANFITTLNHFLVIGSILPMLCLDLQYGCLLCFTTRAIEDCYYISLVSSLADNQSIAIVCLAVLSVSGMQAPRRLIFLAIIWDVGIRPL